MKKRFTASEIINISRVDILDTDEPTTEFFRGTFSFTGDKPLEVGRKPLSSYFGSDIKIGYFLRCQKKEPESDQIAL